ncbi:MAG: glycerophosphodiester phosphodiesterase, partial [Bacteroidetes bacterium]
MQKSNVMVNEAARFDLQGHRGCRGLLPENTIAAMLKAIDLGVTTLEMDVVITADSQVVLSHEPFFNHEISTKPNGNQVTEAEEKDLNIYKMGLAQVQAYDVGLRP